VTDCRGVLDRLWEYLDGEMPQRDAEAIRAHLAGCEHCNPQYRFQLRFLNALVRAHAAREVPRPEFVRRLRATLGTIGRDLA
jgi:anti-sigma factor (TIGR02949 family)